MALTGRTTPYSQIKQLITIDPEKGCSLKAIRQAAAVLGFPVEVRFVNPKEIRDIPRPCIIHGITSVQSGIGHFVILVDYHMERGTCDVIDPDYERFTEVKVDSLLSTFSGYAIVPLEGRWGERQGLPAFSLLLLTSLAAIAVVLSIRYG
jgi:ABC-type bacteriocin/lantibiotic exporter with double-glycine peptidase domain